MSMAKKDEKEMTTEGTSVPPADSTPSASAVGASEKSGEEMVSVPKSLIEGILKKQEEFDAREEERDKKIQQLEYAADKSRMGVYEGRNKGELIRTFAVGHWPIREGGETKEYIVRGTKLVDQDVAIEENGGVRRLVQGVDDDGKERDFATTDIPYVDFYRNVHRKRFPVVKESKTPDGDFRTLRFEDGREVEFDIRFLNY